MASYNPQSAVLDNTGAIDINGVAYSAKDTDIRMMGKPLFYVKSLSWELNTEKEYDTGMGQVGKYLGQGLKKGTGSIELGLSEYKLLTDAAFSISPTLHDVTDLPPFTITITNYSALAYVRKTNLFNVTITKVGGDQFAEGSMFTYKSLDFIFTSVEER
jgi:hypothetical protein